MEIGNKDPFASLNARCHIPPSQDLVLRNCNFDRELQFFSSNGSAGVGEESSQVSHGISVDPVCIMMVTPPESPHEESARDDQFQTPPENLAPSSQEQRVDTGGGVGETVFVDGGCTDVEGLVDLGRDTDLGSYEVRTQCGSLEERCNMEIGDHCKDSERKVALGRRTDLGFSEVGTRDVSSEEHHSTEVDDYCKDAEQMVDLLRDANIGFSEVHTGFEDHHNKDIGDHIHRAEDQVIVGGDDTEGTIDLGKDSNPRFLEAKLTGPARLKSDALVHNEDLFCENPSKKLKLCDESLEPGENSVGSELIIEDDVFVGNRALGSSESLELEESSRAGGELMIGDDVLAVNCDRGSSECLRARDFNEFEESEERIIRVVEDSESERISQYPCKLEGCERDDAMADVDLGLSYNPSTEVNDSRLEVALCIDNELHGNIKKIDDLEKFSYVAPSGTNPCQVRRQLPPSMRRQVGNVGNVNCLVSSSSSPGNNQSIDCLLHVLKVLADKCEPPNVNDGADILEIAMRRGMTLPRPSWWAPNFRPSWSHEG